MLLASTDSPLCFCISVNIPHFGDAPSLEWTLETNLSIVLNIVLFPGIKPTWMPFDHGNHPRFLFHDAA